MLKKLRQEDFDEYAAFAYSLALDQSSSSYPTYTDSIKTREDFFTRARRSFSRDNEDILLFYDGSRMRGWIHYYILEEDRYISFCAFNIESGSETAVNEFLEHISPRYKGFTVHLGLPKANIRTGTALMARGFSPSEESYVDVLHFEKYSLLKEHPDIARVTRKNFPHFAALHTVHDADMYWNNKRLYDALDEWSIYLYYARDLPRGAIYFNRNGMSLEIFGVDHLNGEFDEEVFRALLIKALNEGKKDGARDMTFFNGKNEHDTVSRLGFEHMGEYILYEKIL